jgi:hypothetical protein
VYFSCRPYWSVEIYVWFMRNASRLCSAIYILQVVYIME